MPNWCSNTVEIAHEDPAMLKRAVDAFNRGELLNEFIPVPQDLKIVAGCVGSADDPKQIALEAQEKANIEKHGYKTWYEFCVNEWGTKWDIGGTDMDPIVLEEGQTDTTLCFESAWAPPVGAYDKLEALGFSIRAYYYEPGMAFAGIYEDGHDDYYEYSDMNSEQVAEELPTELDEMFGISESMAEWEEDNKEDAE